MRIASNLENLRALISEGGSDPIYIGGELVYVTKDRDELDAMLDGDGEFVRQQARSASRLRVLDRSNAQLHVAIARDVVDLASDCPVPIYLVVDQYLAYGLAQKQDTIVIGGGVTSSGQINVETFVFSNQKLEKTIEKTLPATGAIIDANIGEIVAEYPDSVLRWCEPLGEAPLCDLSMREGFLDVGFAPFKSPVKKRVASRAQGLADEGLWLIPSLALLLLSGVAYAGLVAYEKGRIEDVRDEFKAELRGFEEAYQSGAQNLELLRHRDHMIRTPPDHTARVKGAETMLHHLAAINGVIIQSVRYFAQDDPLRALAGAAADGSSDVEFEIEFSVPKIMDSARDQVEPVLAMLSSRLSRSVRVISHLEETRKLANGEIEYWRYKVVGAAL